MFRQLQHQGTNPVASCVVFRNGRPSKKKDYRHFNIRTVEGPDDFASMKKSPPADTPALSKKAKACRSSSWSTVAKGQLSSAVEALDEMGLRGQIAAVGIAKRLEEIYFPGDSIPLYIDKNSETLRVVHSIFATKPTDSASHTTEPTQQKRTRRSISTASKALGQKTAELCATAFSRAA